MNQSDQPDQPNACDSSNQPNQRDAASPTSPTNQVSQDATTGEDAVSGQSSAMLIAYDDFYLYSGYFNHPAICHLRIYTARGSLPVVIATELQNNIGVSITRQFAELATDVWRQRLLPQHTQARDGCLWIEHRSGRPAQPRTPDQQEQAAKHSGGAIETFDRVLFSFTLGADGAEHLSEPVRIPMTRAEVEQIIGQPFANPPRRHPSWTS